jgi:TFIIH p62 subunit, N-terminal domain
MSISFDEKEQILFKNKATYNSKNGEIVVTSLRFAWVSSGSGDQEFQTAWANIQNIKYSPADDPKERVMAMIQMVAGSSSEKPPVFHLIGPTKQSCRIELERLKSVVANVRKGRIPEASETKCAKPVSSVETNGGNQNREKKRSRTQMMVDKNSAEYGESVALAEKRKELLGTKSLIGNALGAVTSICCVLT